MKIIRILLILFLSASPAFSFDELDPISIPIPQEASRHLSDIGPTYDPDEDAVIRIMVVYTAKAEQWATDQGGRGYIDFIIQYAMDYAQITADNSSVGIEFDLVGTVRTTYIESGDSVIDLYRLTDINDGYMDYVHDYRDEYAADLVVLLAHVQDVGGVAWLMNNPRGNSQYGFSLTRVQQAAGSTFVHEIGHNLGLHHSKLQNFQPGPGVFSYSAGGRWIGSDGEGYCSVMTYTGGSYFADGRSHWRVPVFSNPNLLHLSAPTGDAQHADNSRTAREMKHVIAAYRLEGGSLLVTLDPETAQWRPVDSDEWYDSGYELSLPVGPTEIEFSDVRGWVMPQLVTVQIDENKLTELKVTYEIETCIVIVAPTSGGRLVPAGAVVNYGETATFTVVPDSGYKIGAVSGCGGSLVGSVYTTGLITDTCTVTARFEAIPEPIVATSGGGGGCFINSIFH